MVRLLRLHGWILDGLSRVLPIVLSMVLAWWLLRRLGACCPRPASPDALSLRSSLSLRLVFEENLHHTYYFMALAVALLLLDVVRGHIRGTFVAWVILARLPTTSGSPVCSTGCQWRLGAQ